MGGVAAAGHGAGEWQGVAGEENTHRWSKLVCMGGL